ncbi:hypothetical protein BD770DRAFT_390543 [Pilaira anomala]|nr:hypothetical protein BD770DRAFT_390543 [Pilaira anomala]
MSISKSTLRKSWISLFVSFLFLILFLSFSSLPNSSSSSSTTKIVQPTTANRYNRLTHSHQELLNSALAHIRLAYVANRTPHYSTPPLLILYTTTKDKKKRLGERLLDITNAYFFSMLQPGSAFAYDMQDPIKFEWFFMSSPAYMSMNTDQAYFYKQRTTTTTTDTVHVLLTTDELISIDFKKNYSQIKIVSTTDWPKSTSWISMAENPSLKYGRDRYRLNHLEQKSDWFWIATRLLFSTPEPHFLRTQLASYRDIMGGRIDTEEEEEEEEEATTRKELDWFRIGLRIDLDEGLECLINHVVNTCLLQQSSCHVFLSSSDRNLFNKVRNKLRTFSIAIHAVAEGFGFADLNQVPEHSLDHSIFDKQEDRIKRDYARTFMDWIILSRMDYLVGQHHDDFLKTAAWAAQVNTDVYLGGVCRIIPMSDW